MLILFELRKTLLGHSNGDHHDQHHVRLHEVEMNNSGATQHSDITAPEMHDAAGSTAVNESPERIDLQWFKRVGLNILHSLLTTPPLIGIIIGLFYSGVITSHYYNIAKSPPYVLPSIIDTLVTQLGDSVSPIAAVSIGFFFNGDYWVKVKEPAVALRVAIYLVTKLFLLPLLCIPLVMMFGIQDRVNPAGLNTGGAIARAAIYIASLPVAVSSFSLAKQ